MSRRSVNTSALVFLALAACSTNNETAGPSLVCGDGTVEEDGACVSVEGTTPPDTTDELVCGEGTVEVDGACVSDGEEIVCGDGTVLVDGECVAEEVELPLVPGRYNAPLQFMQRLQSVEDHMHIYEVKYRESDAKLFYCSYTFGVLDASDPYDLDYLA